MMRWKLLTLAAMLLTIAGTILLGALVSHYRNNYLHALEKQEEYISLAQSYLDTITRLKTQDAQNRALMAAQLEREQQLRKEASDNERNYRDAIKSDACASRVVPGAVIGLLQQPDTAASADSSAAP